MPTPKRKTRSRNRPRPLLAPTGVQLAYTQALLEMLEYARALVHERLLPRVPYLVDRAAPLHTDAAPGARVNRIIDQISDAFYKRFNGPRLNRLAERYMNRTQSLHKGQFAEQIKAAVGIDMGVIDKGLRARIAAATSENVALIKSIPQQYLDQVEKITVNGIRTGARHEQIAKDLEGRVEVARSSAKLVARDQTLKLFGEMNRVRQQAIGVKQYIWRTVSDERVRNAHDEFDGNMYSWDDPPGDGSPEEGTHPATAINCRCYADPVLDDIFAESDSI